MTDHSATGIIIISAGITVLGVFFWHPLARRLGLVAAPNPLVPHHVRPIAHLGGLPVALGIAGAVFVFQNDIASIRPPELTLAIAASATLFLVLGIWDDVYRLAPRSKLVAQVVVAAISVILGVVAPITGLPILDWAISFFWIVLLVNAVNVTDVADGLVAGLMAIAMFCWTIVDPGSQLIGLSTCGACLGFLLWNRPPARIFLGDTGSQLLGFLLAATTLGWAHQSSWRSGTAAVILAGPFLIEVALLVIARRKRGIPWWRGSADHFALRLRAAGWSGWQVDFIAWGTAVLFGSLAVLVVHSSMPLAMIGLLSFAICVVLSLRWLWGLEPPANARPRHMSTLPPQVLWIHQNFGGLHEPGNPRASHLLKSMIDQGWNVQVITGRSGYLGATEDLSEPGAGATDVPGLTIYRVGSRGDPHRRITSHIQFLAAALAALRRVGPIDIIYVSTPPLPQVLLGIFMSVSRSAPLVLEVRDLWPDFLVSLKMIRSRCLIASLSLMESLAYRYAHLCVAVSPAYVGHMMRRGTGGDRLLVAPTGAEPPDRDQRAGRRHAWRAAQGLHDHFVVLYTGSFNTPYAIDQVIKAAELLMQRCPKVVWVLAGNGRDRGVVEDAAGRMSAVRSLGLCSRKALGDAYAGADAGLVSLADVPPLKTVIPGKLFDYLSEGLPVISTMMGMTGAILARSDSGRVVSSPDELADVVEEWTHMPSGDRRALGESGRHWIQSRMSARQNALIVMNGITGLLARRTEESHAPRLIRALVFTVTDAIKRAFKPNSESSEACEQNRLAEESLDAWLDGKWQSLPALRSSPTHSASEPRTPG